MATVLLVRHADIDLPPSSNDPPLNSAGMERANELVHVAGLAGITAVFTSSLARTKQTVGPLAARLGIQPREVPPPPVFAEEILSGTVGQVVLVAGHSNTVPQMIEALGARRFHSRSANASSTTCSWSPCLVRYGERASPEIWKAVCLSRSLDREGRGDVGINRCIYI